MPNEQQYLAAADRFRGKARQLDSWVARTPNEPTAPFLVAPALAATIDSSFSTLRGSLIRAADGLRSIATTCDRRADICREYADRKQAWLRATNEERSTMPYPSRPAQWVDL